MENFPSKITGLRASMYQDITKLLGNPLALQERLRQIDEPHVAPLTKFVRALRSEMGGDAQIPNFDPWDGGIEAEVLFLLEAPGSKARDSGFVSRNNPDETAKNLHELAREAGIDRKRSVVWNVVPWYIGSERKIRAANAMDVSAGMGSLDRLLDLLPLLRVVVLFGKKAQRAEAHIRSIRPGIKVSNCPHPSPLFVNRKPGNRELLLSELRTARSLLEDH